MDTIPKPQVLDPDRPLRPRGPELSTDDRSRAKVLDMALHESCADAQQLWDQLDAIRTYLLDSLPPDPHQPGPHPRQTSASPTGPDDERGWSSWVDAFAAVSSVLCGAHGDDGLGVERGREAAQQRRSVPDHSDQVQQADDPPSAYASPSGDVEAGTAVAAAAQPGPLANKLFSGAVIVLGLLALRGLRPRPHSIRPRQRSTG